MDRERVEKEIEQDRRALEPVLSGLVSGISRPDSLSAPALLRQLEETPFPARRPVRWLRPIAACAAVAVVCAGALLALWRQGFSASLSAGNETVAALQGSSSSAMAAAGETEETAGEPEAMLLEDAEDTAAEEGAAAPHMAQQGAEEMALAKSAAPGASLAAACLPGIIQTDVAEEIKGKSLAQDKDYLYYLAPPSGEEASLLYIVHSADMQTAAKIEVQADMQAQAVLVAGDRLALVSDETERDGEAFTCNVRADIYDVQDRSDPKLSRTIRQDGQLAASALQAGRLCLVSTCPAADGQMASDAAAAPSIQDSLFQEEKVLSEEKLLLPEGAQQPVWTVFTLLELDGKESCASLAVFGGTDSLLLEEKAAYLAVTGYSGEQGEWSSVLSLSLEDGVLRQKAFVRLKGSLLLPQALTPLQDGLLAAVEQEGKLCLYRMDASLSQLSKWQP